MRKGKIIKKSVYILTEGNTEEAYFSRIGEIVGGDTEWRYSVKVEVREIIDGSYTDPVNIVREAKKSKKDYDEVWVVFDKDRERDDQNAKAIELAKKSKVNVAFSSISFEHWLILHFEKNSYRFQRSDCESRSTRANPIVCSCSGLICASTYLKSSNSYPAFKKGYSLLYDDLQVKNIDAIENAAWLRNQLNITGSIHLLNPYSDVDILLCELLNLDRVEYVSLGTAFKFNSVQFTFERSNRVNNIISVQTVINNLGVTSFVINDNLPINIVDTQRVPIAFNSIATQVLSPGMLVEMSFDFDVSHISNQFHLKAQDSNRYILVDII
jgi:hypothetical protein